jgi:cephalosporin hydroxylase
MKRTTVLAYIASLMTSLAVAFSGCSDSTSGGGDTGSQTPAVDRTAQFAADVAKFEHAAGTDSEYTAEQMHEIMVKMAADPTFKNKFMGVPTLQNPTDLWIVMEIMWEMKPDLIVESGTYKGGSAPFWAIILEHMNPNGRVITIDIEDQRTRRAKNFPITKKRVDFLLGSSTDPEIVAEVHRRAQGKNVLVILDSLHSKKHVADELAAYAPLISVGGYIIVQDTSIGPLPAIDEFLAANPNFIADRSKERYSDTNTVRGYLKRVRL